MTEDRHPFAKSEVKPRDKLKSRAFRLKSASGTLTHARMSHGTQSSSGSLPTTNTNELAGHAVPASDAPQRGSRASAEAPREHGGRGGSIPRASAIGKRTGAASISDRGGRAWIAPALANGRCRRFSLYRWQYTMALSILHRVTGCALVGRAAAVRLLAGRGCERRRRRTKPRAAFFAHPLVRVLLIGFSFAFFYHLLNGVRHLTWDTGHGLERKARA